jgi:hypothetical protein
MREYIDKNEKHLRDRKRAEFKIQLNHTILVYDDGNEVQMLCTSTVLHLNSPSSSSE